jgi:nitroreductase
MELYDAIMTTRAMRRLSNEPPVTDEEIEVCLRAANQAPSGGNSQPWHFLVVTDPDQRALVAEVYQRAERRYMAALLPSLPPFRSEAEEASFMRGVALTRRLAEHLAEVPLVLFCLAGFGYTLSDDEGPIDIGTLHASILPAVQNFMLAARDLGLGTTLTTVFRAYQDEIKEIVGLGDRHEIIALVPIGRPQGRFGVAPRKPVEKVTSWNRFGERRPFHTPDPG